MARGGEPIAVVVSAEELAGLEDTVELLEDPVRVGAVDEGIADTNAGRLHDEDVVLADLRLRRDQR